MSLATITFWGESFNVYGVPDELYIYLISITVNQAMGNGDKIVRIIPISENAPKPLKGGPFIVRKVNLQDALMKAYNNLMELKDLQNLKSHQTLMTTDERKLQFTNH